MSTANLDSADLKAVTKGGLIREDVMEKIWDLSKIPLPLTDLIGTDVSRNSYKEWTIDALATPDLTNANVDGADASGNNTVLGTRVGNQHQILDKVVRVSDRAQSSDLIGRANELGYQLSRRQQEIKRDLEAIALSNQASVADNGDSTAGKLGGLPSWIETSYSGGTKGGFSTSTGLTVARTLTTRRALTETLVRDGVQTIYQNGGDASVLMSYPAVIRKISEYLFSSSARIATLMSDVVGAEKATAVGSVSVFVTDFGILKMVPNRLQQIHKDSGGTNDCADVFLIDPMYLSFSYLGGGVKVKDLARTGTADNKQMTLDATLIVHNEKAHGIIGDIDYTASMTA